MSRNGEAIFGSRPWTIPAEGPTRPAVGSFVDGASPLYTAEDIRFTTRTDVTGDYVYATLLAWPADGIARVRSFGTASGLLSRGIKEVSTLGDNRPVEWSQGPTSLEVPVPEHGNRVGGPVIRIYLEPIPRQARTDFLHG